MSVSKKFVVILLSLVLVLSLAACGPQKADPMQPGEQTGKLEAAKELYIISESNWGGKNMVVNEKGQVVLAMDYNIKTIINDTFSGEVKYIAVVKPEIDQSKASNGDEDNEEVDWESTKYLSALYDTTGKVVFDYTENNYYGLYGKYLTLFNREKNCIDVMDIVNGKIIYTGLTHTFNLKDKLCLFSDQDKTLIAIDQAGKRVFKLSDISWADSYIYKNQQSDYCYIEKDDSYYLLDSTGKNVISQGAENLFTICGNFAIVDNLEKSGQMFGVDLATGQTLFTSKDRIKYFDGLVAIITKEAEEKDYLVLVESGSILSEGYDNLNPGSYQESTPSNYFVAQNYTPDSKGERKAQIAVLDNRGKVIEDVGQDYHWVQVFNDNMLIRAGEAASFGVIGEQSKIDAKYMDITPCYDSKGNMLPYLMCMFQTAQDVYLYDIIDTEGKVVLADLKAAGGFGADKLVCTKGFSRGLMDFSGKWLYQTSIFTDLSDE